MVLFVRGHLGISEVCARYRTPPTSKPFFFPQYFSEDSCHSEHSGAEETVDGLGYLHEDS